MKNIFVLIWFLIFLSGTRSFAQEEVELRLIETLGKNIYEYDTACWEASDVLQSKNPNTSLLSNFVALKDNEVWKVGFGKLSESDKCFLLAYEIIVNLISKKTDFLEYKNPQKNTEFYFVASKAYYAAYNELENKSIQYNYAVLRKDADNLYVYFYPAQVSYDYYYLGGDTRFTYNVSLDKITNSFKLHKSILKMPYNNKGNEEAVATMSNAVLTSTPVETDILYVLSRKFRGQHYLFAGEWVFIIDENGLIKSKIKKDEFDKM